MAKKKKNPEIATTNNASSTVFDTLFGNLPENRSSIFSDQNPFKRVPNEPILQNQVEKQHLGLKLETPNLVQRKRKKDRKDSGFGSGSGSDDETVNTLLAGKKPKKGESENAELEKVEVENGAETERKRKKDRKDSGFGSGSGSDDETGNTLLAGKKPKKGESENADLSAELEKLEVENGAETGRKRKRDEVEAEYEAQRYGGGGEGERKVGGKRVGEKRKKADEQADMAPVAKEGFDDEAKLLRTVFVGNLPLKVKKKGLFAEFRQFGDVESVRIRSVPLLDTKIPRKGAIIQKKINDAVDSVHAYIVFKTEEAAQAALAHNMSVVGGNHIRVDRACPPRKKLKGDDNAPLYDNKRTVFVGNLPFDVKDEEIYQLFSGIKDLESTSIEGIRVIRDPGSSLGKGIAYVLFKTRVDANLVVRKHGLKLRDRELRISHAKSNLPPSKRKDSPSGDRNDSGTKKLAVESTSNSKYKFNATGSYQGLRATKSGVEKKTSRPKHNEPVKFKPKARSEHKKKERSEKRPSVAARKAKEIKGGDGSGSKQGGFKRKMDNRTPNSARAKPNKKAKKF